MRCHWIAAGIVLCLLAADGPDRGFTYPPLEKGDTKGVLTVTVAEEDASKPAEVDYRLEILAADDTDIKDPELLNSAAWKVTPGERQVKVHDDRQTVRFHLHLEQKEPGVEPLPGVTVRFRKNGEEGDLTWPDILRQSRELPPPEVNLKPPLQPGHTLWWILGIVVVLAVALVVVWRTLWNKQAPPPLTPAAQALRDLDRIEGLGLAGPDETGWYPAEMSGVIRRYLSERYGLPAQQQTTAEFLHSLRQTPELSEEVRQTLKDLLERCDLAKFAAQRTPPDECRRLAGLARMVVRQTAPTSPSEPGLTPPASRSAANSQ